MELTLYRYPITPDDVGVFGYLLTEDGAAICETLEHDFGGKPIVPPGKYTCVKGEHCLKNGRPFTTFEVTGVPGHWGILFHCGNKNADSQGCILVGDTFDSNGEGMILGSRNAFKRFMEYVGNTKEFTLHVLE
jgi:hypothetical protein